MKHISSIKTQVAGYCVCKVGLVMKKIPNVYLDKNLFIL